MHYAVPRMLFSAGLLERFYTDIYAVRSWSRFLSSLPSRVLPSRVRRLLGRSVSNLPEELIWSYPLFGLEYYVRRCATDPETINSVDMWAGKVFGQKVLRDGFGGANAVYAYNTAGLEILTAARRAGLTTVLEQTIAPRRCEESLMEDAQKRYCDWEPPRRESPTARAIADREREEWAQSDVIICGSDFVVDGIRQCGGPVDRCRVVHYGVDSHFAPVTRSSRGGALRVLTVGQVNLRKGAGCALDVAKVLRGVAEFRWVGPVSLSDAARIELASVVNLIGPVARQDISEHYNWADVFFLPSICEGSATVTYEALACGLPVVTTPNAGSPVRNGEDGFIVQNYDVAAMVHALRQLHRDRDMLQKFSQTAILHSRELTLTAYRERLLAALF